jgi:hypothetical protein
MTRALLSRISAASPAKATPTPKTDSNALRIGEPNDAFEREADRVADRLGDGGTINLDGSLAKMNAGSHLQRKCDCGSAGECEECKTDRLQREAIGSRTSSPHPSEAPPIVHEVLRSPGQPLDTAARAFLEPRFNHDFGRVRVHTDARAARSARAVNAHAFTVGRQIVFGTGEYQPGTNAGIRLLAHELTHIVQQRNTSPTSIASQLNIRPARDPHEQEALNHAGGIVEGATGCAMTISGVNRAGLQRFALFDFIGDVFTKGPFEAFSRLFGEGQFSERELKRYLNLLREGKPEGRYDSDNKARAVVRLWKGGSLSTQLTPQIKKLLVREMWQGTTSTGDAQGILDVLERSTSEDLSVILDNDGVTPKQLADAIGKSEQPRLRRLFDQRLQGGFNAAVKGTVRPVGSITTAPYLNDESFRKRWTKGLDEALVALRKLTANGGCSFPRPDERRIDDVNWKPFQSPKDMILGKEGYKPRAATPFEAVSLLFENLDKWSCDCRLFPEIAQLYAWHEALKDSPDAFNNKFVNLVLAAGETTGLERESTVTDEDLAWRNAPVGTIVAWSNNSPAARVPWTFEHGIKSFKGGPGQEDHYAAHPLGYDLTEREVKERLARNSSDYPWKYALTATALSELAADGVDRQILKDLSNIQGVETTGAKAFLDLAPLVKLRTNARQDPPRFSGIINNILKHARQQPDPKDSEAYIATYVARYKLQVPK